MGFQRKWRSAIDKPLTPDEAMVKLERFCLFRERCPQEVKDKIKELRLSDELGDTLFHTLMEDRYFEEQRFTSLYVRSKIKSWGKIRVRLELQLRKIHPDCIEQAFQEIDEEAYRNTVVRQLTKKLQQWVGDPQARQKAAAAVIRMGFESDLVFSLLKGLPSSPEDLSL